MPATPSLRRLAALLALSLASTLAVAQSEKSDKPLTDAERAKRDAERVFNFIKFQTVRPAPAPAPARPAPAPAARSAAAPAASPAPATPPVAEPAPASRGLTLPADGPAVSEPTLTTAELPASAVVRANESTLALAPKVEVEEVPLKLAAYVPPEMTSQVLAAMNASQVVVPVRFVVQPDGRVSTAQALGNAPRRVQQAAVRAVQQWRFDPIPSLREVDVEIAFRTE